MPNTGQGSIRLFRFSGVQVFLHWSWFLVAAFEIQNRKGRYSSVTWNVLEYMALFLIVLLHEFGHALACRQVGGKADRIVLWPLGGVAYVDPPPRPGATLWSIAAGPLVNVVIVPVLGCLAVLTHSPLWTAGGRANFHELIPSLFWINVGLLVRPDPPLTTLVCAGTRPQFDGRYYSRPDRRSWFYRPRSLETRPLVRGHCRLHADELLGRPATGPGVVTCSKVAASGWICLPNVQDSPADRGLLEVRKVRAGLRHVPNPGYLSELLGSVCPDEVPGLWKAQSHE